MNANTYIEENRERFLEELFALLRIPSISTDSQYAGDVRKAAEMIKQRLEEAGVDFAEIHETPLHPIVYAEKQVDASLPTVLVYGHYDVQPPDPLALWTSPPFEPTIKDEKIYARGSSDDKGQMYMHIKAMETMQALGEVPCNIKFLIEGEEEIGSDNLDNFVEAQQEKLKADVVLISDTSIIANDTPSITAGVRGMSYIEIELTGPNRDLHSGTYGGGVANPINVLTDIISSLHDEHRRISIPGFYEDVLELNENERSEMARIPFDEAAYKDSLGVKEVMGEDGFTTLERTSSRPTLDVNGIWGGYTGEGAKTVIASKASAKISMRLVPNQDPEKITKLFMEHLQKIVPPSVSIKFIPHHGGYPALTPIDSVAFQAASRAFEEVWGKTPIPKREGGSIPIVAMFEKVLGIKTVLMGFGLDSDSIHSPDEHYGIFNYFQGIETITQFYKHYQEMMKR